MPRHIDKVEAHAAKELRGQRKKVRSRKDLIQLYKRFLKIEEHRIKLLHRAGGGGLEIARKRADLLDVVLRSLFTEALEDAPGTAREQLTLVASGGYGRALLNPGSDVDLLFLCRDSGAKLGKETEEIIEQILYMLWDVGFKLGHATRSIRECIRIANTDHQVKSALIETRLITGDPQLFDEFEQRFYKSSILGHREQYLDDRLRDLRSRYAKYSNTVYLQEPHVKNGCGALRDYHNLVWVTYVLRGTRDLHHHVEQKDLTVQAHHEIERAYDFLLRVRNDLHYSERRATDTLTLRLQGVIATNFDYPQKSILRRCEEFMRDYYLHTLNLFQHSTSLMERFELEQQDEASAGRRLVSFLALRRDPVEEFDGFYSRGGRIYPLHNKTFDEDSNRLVRLFQHAQQRHLTLSPQIRQLVKNNWAKIDRPFRYRKSARETFEAILSRKGDVGRTLRMMHRTGVLGRYLPEFGALTCLVQHEFFHRYTADEHTLTCIDKLDELSDSDDPKVAYLQELFHKMEDPYVMYLALILHDTGRAANVRKHADASAMLANRVCNRLSMRLDRRRLVLHLVDHHLTFWRTATTKNIADPNVIQEFARVVRNKHYLDMLFLLTYADSKGTNDDAWSDWKESLMRQLYQSTVLYLEDRGAFDSRTKVPSRTQREHVHAKLPDDFGDEIEAHFNNMPSHYFLFRGEEGIVRHVRAFRKFLERVAGGDPLPAPVLAWHDRKDRGYSEIYVCSWDRERLVLNVTGALAANQINVLGADLYVRKDNLVLDIFRVCTTNFEPVTDPATRAEVERLLGTAMAEHHFDFAPLIGRHAEIHPATIPNADLMPTRVVVTNRASPDFTVIEIQAVDRLGLLYDLFWTVGDFGYSVSFARISTEKGAAIDTIYVTDHDGKKIAGRKALEDLRQQLAAYVGPSPPRRQTAEA